MFLFFVFYYYFKNIEIQQNYRIKKHAFHKFVFERLFIGGIKAQSKKELVKGNIFLGLPNQSEIFFEFYCYFCNFHYFVKFTKIEKVYAENEFLNKIIKRKKQISK